MLVLRIIIFLLLAGGLTGLFYILRKSRILKKKLREAYDTLDIASLQRARERKEKLSLLEEQSGLVGKLEQRFVYSGIGKFVPFLTAEMWVLVRIMFAVFVYFASHFIGESWLYGILGAALSVMVLYFIESMLMYQNFKAVDESLVEFLNILGNYSITAGEVTGILNQVSKYMKEPLKSALDACYFEAQTTGDVNNALLYLADKIEHPKFKEIVTNIEICSRYSADFSMVVSSSRRSIQDYIKSRQERKAMAQEAMVSMFIILLLLIAVLFLVDQIVSTSIWTILFHTWVGRACVGIVTTLIGVFYWQILMTEK